MGVNGILADHVAANQILARHVVAQTLTGDKLVIGGVGALQLARGSVIGDKLPDAVITSAKIGRLAVNDSHIRTLAADKLFGLQAEFDDLTVRAAQVTGTLVASQIDTRRLSVDLAYVHGLLDANMITGLQAEFDTLTVQGAQIRNLVVTSAEIGTAAITSLNLATGAVTAGKAAADAIDEPNLTSGVRRKLNERPTKWYDEISVVLGRAATIRDGWLSDPNAVVYDLSDLVETQVEGGLYRARLRFSHCAVIWRKNASGYVTDIDFECGPIPD